MRRGVAIAGVGLLGAALVVACAPTRAFAAEAGTEEAGTAQFGVVGFSIQASEAPEGTQEGASESSPTASEADEYTSAGGHPFALTSRVEFASEVDAEGDRVPTQEPKDILIGLPPGLIADPLAVPRCGTNESPCPTDTQVGTFIVHASVVGVPIALLGPIVDLVPSEGRAAELGMVTPLGTLVLAGRLARGQQGYGLTLAASDLPGLSIVSLQITLWGYPADRAHDAQRGETCSGQGRSAGPEESCEGGGSAGGEERLPFLTLGDDCASAQTATLAADSWEDQGAYVQAQARLPAQTDCEAPPLRPELSVRPDSSRAQAPVALDVNISERQSEGEVTAAPPLREASLRLPAGLAINPGVGNGLQACAASGPSGFDVPTGRNAAGLALTPGELGEGEELPEAPLGFSEPQLTPGHCPSASVIGIASARTPLLAEPLQGRVYLAAPGCGGPGQQSCTAQDAADGNLYRVYVELGGVAERGSPQAQADVIVKATGQIEADPTGRLTVRLSELPQLPLGELSLELFGGPSALLANPETCGPAQTTGVLTPWSAPDEPAATVSSSYEVGNCNPGAPFAPTLVAGSENILAGAFTPFTIRVQRGEGWQNLSTLDITTPPGLLAALASVTPCPEAQASTGACPEASRVGEAIATAGSGSEPLYLRGSIYLTGAYDGAPYGLSIAVPAVAGPLNLGLLTVRARVYVDPQTASLQIVSDPLPQVVLGVPLRLQSLALNIDRPGFILNPTSCNPMQIAATIGSAAGASATVTNRFQLAECPALKLTPSLSASVAAPARYTRGARLQVRLIAPAPGSTPTPTPGSAQANLASVRLTLPEQLPARLTALQNACPSPKFASNPANCPPASAVGTATVRTPLLPAPLSGPVYLVSHGRSALPAPAATLTGDGLALRLNGATSVATNGTTTIAFSSLPDIPLASLELSLPEGPGAAIGANADLCKLTRTVTVRRTVTRRVRGRRVRQTRKVRKRVPASMAIAAVLTAQDGFVRHLSVPVEVEGCARASKRPQPHRSTIHSPSVPRQFPRLP